MDVIAIFVRLQYDEQSSRTVNVLKENNENRKKLFSSEKIKKKNLNYSSHSIQH